MAREEGAQAGKLVSTSARQFTLGVEGDHAVQWHLQQTIGPDTCLPQSRRGIEA